MKLKKGFVLRDVCGEQVIMGEGLGALDFGRLLCLNETASWLWRQAESFGEFTVESLSQSLCHEYDVDLDLAQTDVASIVEQWKNVGVIEE